MKKGISLKQKVVFLLTAIVVVVAVSAWAVSYRTERRKIIDGNSALLSRYLDIFAESGRKNGLESIRGKAEFWSKVYPEGRITLIAADGKVLYDSKALIAELDNHLKRPEVINAFAVGRGSELRYSATQRTWQNYMAVRVRPDTAKGDPGSDFVVRLSYPVAALNGLASSMAAKGSLYLCFILALVWICAYWILRQMMAPLRDLCKAADDITEGGDARFPITADRDMQKLSNALNTMYDSLNKSAHIAFERKEEMSQLVGALPTGVILIDDDRKIRYINTVASRLCGRGDDLPPRGTSVEVVLPSEEICAMLDASDGTKTVTVKRRRGFSLEVTTLKIQRGRLITLQDLTEKMQLEEARRDFFIDVGHEFRTPLTVIRMGLDLLKSCGRIKNEEDLSAIENMTHQQERLSRLVDDMLLLVRLDADPLMSNIEDIDLAKVEANVIEEARALPQSGGIDFRVSLPERAEARGCLGDLRRALFNLVENGVKYVSQYHRDGGGVISCELKDNGAEWVVSVDDNGPGIPEDERQAVFERFRRGDSNRARTGKTGGYGLGLSIARRVAERHGGTLDIIDSELGGSKFVFKLPKTLSDEDADTTKPVCKWWREA